MTVMNNYLTEKERIIRRGSKIYKKLYRACAKVNCLALFPEEINNYQPREKKEEKDS